MIFIGLNHRVDWLVEANVSEKHAVPIFRTEVMSRDWGINQATKKAY
jgi:hypothetical protein